MELEKIKKVAERLSNPTKLINDTFSRIWALTEVQAFIVALNQEQLFSGINAFGIELEEIGGEYAPLTVSIKESLGDPTDRVTLFDTGAYYESIAVEVLKDGFQITHDPIKGFTDLRDRWGTDLVGLTPLSRKKLLEFIKPFFDEIFLDELLQ